MFSFPTARRILIAGTGRTAMAVARTYPQEVTAILGRARERASVVAALTAAADPLGAPDEISDVDFNVLWLLTTDSAIAQVLASLIPTRPDWTGITVIHSSGMLPLSLLQPARDAGAATAALHPALSITGRESLPADLFWAGAADGVELDALAAWLLGVEPARILKLEERARPLYHAASSAASNYSVTLFELAVELFATAGINRGAARQMVERYLRTSAERSALYGTAATITGPIVRGDEAVVTAQIEAVRQNAFGASDAFEALARLTRLLFVEGRQR